MILITLTGAAFLSMGALIWWLYADNQALAGEKQRLEQTNAALAESARNQKAVADELQSSIRSRDELARRAIDQRIQSDRRLEAARQALHAALKDNRCASEPHPAAVGDWLRKNSDSL